MDSLLLLFFLIYVVLLKIIQSFTKILIEQQVNPLYLSFASPLLVFILLQEHTNTIWSVEILSGSVTLFFP